MNPEIVEFLGQMSNFELVDLIVSYNNTLLAQLTIFTTALFAYLAGFSFASHRLSRFQLISITVLYSGFCFIVIAGYFFMAGGMIDIVLYVIGIDISIAMYGMGCLLFGGWLLSLVYVKHNTEK